MIGSLYEKGWFVEFLERGAIIREEERPDSGVNGSRNLLSVPPTPLALLPQCRRCWDYSIFETAAHFTEEETEVQRF